MSNLPSLSLETALPPTQRATTQLAPEEVFAPPQAGELRARSEMTPAEKRTQRSKDKKVNRRTKERITKAEEAKKRAGKGRRVGRDEALRGLVKEGRGVSVNYDLVVLPSRPVLISSLPGHHHWQGRQEVRPQGSEAGGRRRSLSERCRSQALRWSLPRSFVSPRSPHFIGFSFPHLSLVLSCTSHLLHLCRIIMCIRALASFSERD